MRVAVAGKGGAGKTTLSATLARLAARAGRPVVAIDADANPNLHTALGLPADVATGRLRLPTSLVSRRRGGTGLTVPVEHVLQEHAVLGPEGVRLVAMGGPVHADEGCLCSAHAVISSLLEDLDDPQSLVVVDMEASPEHLSRGTVRNVDVVWLVAEPYYRSLETVRRMAALVAELPVPVVTVVGNKIRNPGDEAAIGEFCARAGLAFGGAVPWSDEVLVADRERRPVIECPGALPVVDALAALARGVGIAL